MGILEAIQYAMAGAESKSGISMAKGNYQLVVGPACYEHFEEELGPLFAIEARETSGLIVWEVPVLLNPALGQRWFLIRDREIVDQG